VQWLVNIRGAQVNQEKIMYACPNTIMASIDHMADSDNGLRLAIIVESTLKFLPPSPSRCSKARMIHLRSAAKPKVWRIQHDRHYQTSKSASDRNSKNPRDAKKTNPLPVDGFEAAIAQANADSSTCNAH
jgi:hypothetical protein